MQAKRLHERIDTLCKKANELGVSVFIDAEESWIQKPIDELVLGLMAIYNRDKPIIYHTFQFYRKGQLTFYKNATKKQNLPILFLEQN